MNNNQYNQQMPNQNYNNQQMPNQNQYQQQNPNQPQMYYQQQMNQGICCPNCGSHNINIQIVQNGMKTSTKGNGCLWEVGRILLIICTCGLWLLVGKHAATSTTTMNTSKVHICQNCGCTW